MSRRRHALWAITAAVAIVAGWPALDIGGGQATALPNTVDAVETLLGEVTVVDRIDSHPGYERRCGTDRKTRAKRACVFGPAWNDPDDRSGCDTRNRIAAQQLRDVQFKPGTRRCKVIAGRLDPDPYSGNVFDLKKVAADHIYPLKAAWDAGAWQWDLRQRQRFANDPDELLMVSASANSSKGDSTLAQWLPPVDQCGYVARYLAVAVKYQLPITAADHTTALRTCHH